MATHHVLGDFCTVKCQYCEPFLSDMNFYLGLFVSSSPSDQNVLYVLRAISPTTMTRLHFTAGKLWSYLALSVTREHTCKISPWDNCWSTCINDLFMMSSDLLPVWICSIFGREGHPPPAAKQIVKDLPTVKTTAEQEGWLTSPTLCDAVFLVRCCFNFICCVFD